MGESSKTTITSKIKVLDEEKREFASGANRQSDAGKGVPTLCSPIAEDAIAKHMQGGVEAGYDPRNWEQGLPLLSILDSLKRHYDAERQSLTDEDHARSMLWNAHIYVHTKEMIRRGILPVELDNRPRYVPGRCPIHPKYQAKKAPTSGCDICKLMWDNREQPWYRSLLKTKK
jgi:hypothetical protein